MADLGDLSANAFDPFDQVVMTNPNTNPKTWANRLAGTVKVNGVGAVKRVMVVTRQGMRYAGSTMSNADGTWEISGLPETMKDTKMVVLAFDDTDTYNVEAADNVVPVV